MHDAPKILVLVFLLTACAGSGPVSPAETALGPIAFNVSLWQAARETVDFMPLEASDPVAGTIETGWASPRAGEDDSDRYKVSIGLDYSRPYAGAVQVAVRHEIRSGDDWLEVGTDGAIAAGLRNDIVTSAQELRQTEIAGN